MKVVLGDSQAEGLAPFLRASGFTVIDRRGWSTARLRGELGAILARRPELVVLVTGGNDDPDAPGYAELLRGIVAQVRASGAKLVVVGPVFAKVQPDAQVHPRTAAKIRAALAGTGATFIDAQPLTRDLARDSNVHLDRAGYAVYAARLERALRPGSGALLGLALLGAALLTRKWWLAVLPP